MKKTLVISEFGPPSLNGPSAILGSLFRHFPEGSYCLYMDDPRKTYNVNDPDGCLACPYYFFRLPEYRGRRSLGTTANIILHFLLVPLIAVRGVTLARRERVNALLAFNNHGPFLLAAYLIHKILRKPLFIYFLDLYKHAHLSRIRTFVAHRMEGRILRAATKVFVMSEPLQEFYRGEYGIEAEMMPHPVALDGLPGAGGGRKPGDPRQIVYTGQMGDAWLDSTLNMVRVANSLDGVRFSLYVPRNDAYLRYLEGLGITGRNVRLSRAGRSEVARLQREADILFLPLAFQTGYHPLFFRMASPSKMPEYLAAGRPILVHAPPDSYVSQYARKNGFGLVVDRLEFDTLRDATVRLLQDAHLCEDLAVNALNTAKRHDAALVSRRLQEYLL